MRFELTFPIGIAAVNTLPYFSKDFRCICKLYPLVRAGLTGISANSTVTKFYRRLFLLSYETVFLFLKQDKLCFHKAHLYNDSYSFLFCEDFLQLRNNITVSGNGNISNFVGDFLHIFHFLQLPKRFVFFH